MKKTFDDMMTDQNDARGKIISIMEKEKLAIRPMATKIGISANTLTRFVVKNLNIRWVPLCKISEYCAKAGL